MLITCRNAQFGKAVERLQAVIIPPMTEQKRADKVNSILAPNIWPNGTDRFHTNAAFCLSASYLIPLI